MTGVKAMKLFPLMGKGLALTTFAQEHKARAVGAAYNCLSCTAPLHFAHVPGEAFFMIDLAHFRAHPEVYREACRKKFSKFNVDEFLELDARFRELKVAVENLRARQNQFNKDLPKLQGSDKEAKLGEMKTIAADLKRSGQELKEIEDRWNREQLFIPNPPLESVPTGRDSSENVPLRHWGAKPEFSFAPKDHVEIGQSLGILDIERGVKIGGTRSYFLLGDGTRLQHALMSFAMDLLHRKGYVLMEPPHIVKYEAMMGTSYFPGGEDQAYHLDERDQDFYLIGTAEVSVTSFHSQEILPETGLPKRYAGYSPCYRREAGTYGKDTQGVYRIHQFYKVEQVIVCRNDPKESAAMHAELLGNAEELLQLLELPYRVVDVCSGDMGQGQVYKNDIETWMPSRNEYGETHSCSTFYEFQARRLALRYKTGEGKNVYCHTLNNTLVASPRILIPLLEVYQNADGTVRIPKALQPYMGGQECLKPRK